MRIFGDTWKLSKMGKMLSNNKKKFFFCVQRIRINNLSQLVKNLNIFLWYYVNFNKNSSFSYFSIFFHPNDRIKNFLKQHKFAKFDMGFRMVYELSLQNKFIFFAFFWLKSFLMLKIYQNVFSSKCNNSYTIRKPMSNLVDLCCFKKFYTVIWVKKNWKIRKWWIFIKINIIS